MPPAAPKAGFYFIERISDSYTLVFVRQPCSFRLNHNAENFYYFHAAPRATLKHTHTHNCAIHTYICAHMWDPHLFGLFSKLSIAWHSRFRFSVSLSCLANIYFSAYNGARIQTHTFSLRIISLSVGYSYAMCGHSPLLQHTPAFAFSTCLKKKRICVFMYALSCVVLS